jgi:hypothetical protein
LGHNMASWKVLEEMLIALEKKGIVIPENILSDLRSAKSMIKLHCTSAKGAGDALQKAEELSANVEAYLAEEAQKVFGSKKVDEWLRRLEDANIQVCEEPTIENNFVTGVPKDQKWLRVVPIKELPAERLLQIAEEQKLNIKAEKDGRLLVYGQPEGIKAFVKKMTAEATKKSPKL